MVSAALPALSPDSRFLSPAASRHGWYMRRHANVRGMRPMRCSKGIVDEDIAMSREPLGKGAIVIAFPAMKARILQQDHTARRQCLDRFC